MIKDKKTALSIYLNELGTNTVLDKIIDGTLIPDFKNFLINKTLENDQQKQSLIGSEQLAIDALNQTRVVLDTLIQGETKP